MASAGTGAYLEILSKYYQTYGQCWHRSLSGNISKYFMWKYFKIFHPIKHMASAGTGAYVEIFQPTLGQKSENT